MQVFEGSGWYRSAGKCVGVGFSRIHSRASQTLVFCDPFQKFFFFQCNPLDR